MLLHPRETRSVGDGTAGQINRAAHGEQALLVVLIIGNQLVVIDFLLLQMPASGVITHQAVVLVVAALFIVFAYSKAEVGAVEGYEIQAKFDRVDGILAGSDVRMSGIKIGTVTASSLDPKTYFAEVKMNIRSDVKIPDDTSIAVSTDGLLGDKFLALSPGGSDDMLESGGEITTTQGSIDLMSLVGQMIFSQTGKDGDKDK